MSIRAYPEVWLLIRGRGFCNHLLGDLTAGSDKAHNVGVEGQLPLLVHLFLEQLQRACAEPCIEVSLSHSIHLDSACNVMCFH